MRHVRTTIRSAPKQQGGFTLAETLVALFILALVASSGTALLIGATGSGQQLRAAEERAQKLDVAQALIRQDIAALSPRAILPEDGFGVAGNLFGGEATTGDEVLRFVRDGWLNPADLLPRSDLQFVRYRLADGALIREVVTRPDATRGTPVSTRTLLAGVRRIETRFWRGGEVATYWQGDAGQALHILPDLIEFEIYFETGQTLSLATLTGARS